MTHLKSTIDTGKSDSLVRRSHCQPSSLVTLLCILSAAVAVTALVVIAATRIELLFLKNYGFFFDPAAYYVHNIDLHRIYEQQGLPAALQFELRANDRFPGRTLPSLLFAPLTLVQTTGHLWTEAPAMCGFLLLLGTTIHKRTGSLLLCLAAMALFAGIRFLYDPTVGVGAYWLDFPAACALSSAALCLIRFSESKHRGWLLALGAFASITALFRWSSGFYLLSFLSLAVPGVLLKVYWRQWGRLAAAVGLSTLTALPGLAFTLYHWQSNTDYYKRFGFAFGAPISQSIYWTLKTIHELLGTVILAIVLLFIGANLVALVKRKADAMQVLLCQWLPVSIFLFVCLVVKAVDGIHPLVYFAPALFVAAFCCLGPLGQNRMWWRGVSAALLITAVATSALAYDSKRKVAAHPPPALQIQQKCNMALSDLMVSTKASSFTEFDDETVFPHMEVFFNRGRYCGWVAMFSKHEMYMKEMAMHKGKTAQQMALGTYDKTLKEVDLVAVFTNPQDAFKKFDNQYSATVSNYMAKTLPNNPDWKFVGNVESLHGRLSVYKNLKLITAH